MCVYERPVQSWKEAARAEKDGAHRKHGASLVDPVEVTSGHVSHANSSSRTVQELVAISDRERETLFYPIESNNKVWKLFLLFSELVFGPSGVKYVEGCEAVWAFYADSVLINECLLADFVVELCNALVGPVFPQRGQDMTQCVWPRDKNK